MPQSFFQEATLDDVLREAISELLAHGTKINPSRGPARELTGVLIELSNPRARLSRTESRGRLFSCLGELFWYLAASEDSNFIRYYIKGYGRDHTRLDHVPGAYGTRLFSWNGINQFENVATLLREKRDSRRAVIQLFDRTDVSEGMHDIPCTCTLQFLLRDDRLHMVTHMRSNDVHVGLPHDVFGFTMLQEILGCMLAVGLGTYKHMVGSLHLYDSNLAAAETFLSEGWQSTSDAMPKMPQGDPGQSLQVVLEAERHLRGGLPLTPATLDVLDPYWRDLILLLGIFRAFKNRDDVTLAQLHSQMSSTAFDPYIEEKSAQIAQSPPS